MNKLVLLIFFLPSMAFGQSFLDSLYVNSIAMPQSNVLDASSVFDIDSTTAGVLIPRMTSTQRNAIASPATGLLVWDTTVGTLYQYTGAAWSAVGTGTVTSVGLTAPTMFSVSGQPITSSGTIALSLANQSANTFLAGPSAGSSPPTFRTISSTDVPTLNQNTSGTAASLSSILIGTLGGTGVSSTASYPTSGTIVTGTPALHQTVISSGGHAVTGAGPGTSSYPLVSNGVSADPTYQQLNLTAGVTNILPGANGGTGVSSTATFPTSGIVPSIASYGTSGQVLTSTGSAITLQKASGGINPWATSTAYTAGQVITYGTDSFICLSGHTSGTFAIDLANNDWRLTNSSVWPNLVNTGSDFDSGTVEGWSAVGCATITNGFPLCNGTLGFPFTTSNGGRAVGANTSAAALDTSGAIGGSASPNSMKLATTGAGTIGDGIISSFYVVPPKYRGHTVSISIAYTVASGTPALTGLPTSTYAFAIYDVLNNAWLQPSGAFNFIQGTGVGLMTGSFQFPSTSQEFQAFVYSPVAPVGASSFLFKDLSISGLPPPSGAAIGDMTTYSCSGNGTFWTTNVAYTCKGRRVGDYFEGQATMAISGTPGSATIDPSITLPAGYTIDTTKVQYLTGGSSTIASVGSGFTSYATGSKVYNVGSYVTSGSNTVISIGALQELTAFTGTQFPDDTGPRTSVPGAYASGGAIQINFAVPIVGFSAGTIQSQDAGQGVYAFSVNTSTTSASTSSPFVYSVIADDSAGAYNSSTGQYKIPRAGRWSFTGGFYAGATASNSQMYKNGSLLIGGTLSTASSSVPGVVSYEGPFNVGDLIDIRPNNSATASGGATLNYFFGSLVQSSQTIQASDTITLAYTSTAASTIGTSLTVLPFATKYWDDRGEWVTNTFTAAAPGKRKICATVFTAVVALSTSQAIDLAVVQAGSTSVTKYLGQTPGTGGTASYAAGGCADFNMVTGDTLQIEASSSVSTTVNTTPGVNHFEIERVGN
jgi:hypothetical protein